MENNAELVRLEQFVDTLLNKYNDLKNKFYALETTLSERDDEIYRLKNERSEVGSRVSDLLGRIEQWEAEQDDPGRVEHEAENHGNGEFS